MEERPFWLDSDPWVLGLALTAWTLVGGGLVWFLLHRRRSSHERLRQLVLGRLELATERGLPLAATLRALAEDLARRAAGTGRTWPAWLLPLAPLAWLTGLFAKRMLRRESERAFDVAALALEGGLECGLAAIPGSFPEPWPELLGRAEQRGLLHPALGELRRLEREGLGARERVRGRLLYPAAVLCAVFLPIAFQQITMRPRLELIAASVGNEPSPLLLGLLSLERAVIAAVPLLLFAGWLAAGLLAPGAGGASGWLARTLPGTRGLQRAAHLAQAARLLAAAVRAGLPLDEALGLLERAPGLSQAALERARALAREGAGLGEVCRAVGFGGPVATGTPAEALDLLARREQGRLATRVAALSALAFPLALLTVGALIAIEYWIPFLYIEAIERQGMW